MTFAPTALFHVARELHEGPLRGWGTPAILGGIVDLGVVQQRIPAVREDPDARVVELLRVLRRDG